MKIFLEQFDVAGKLPLRRVVMTVPRIIKIIMPIIMLSFFSLPGFSDAGADDIRATVGSESLEVHSAMSESSRVLKTLKKEDIVNVEFEMQGAGSLWCGITEGSQTGVIGYVPCRDLDRGVDQGQTWKMIYSSGIPAGARKSAGEKVIPKRPYSDIQVLLYMTSW
jgi:hypothetical protein